MCKRRYLLKFVFFFEIFSLVHYPEDKKYTIKPLNVTHLAGRDPVTGRVVSICIEKFWEFEK